MKLNTFQNQNLINNNINNPNYENEIRKKPKINLDNNISYSQSDHEDEENDSEDNQNDNNSYNDESDHNSESRSDDSVKFNKNKNNIKKSVNNNNALNIKRDISGGIEQMNGYSKKNYGFNSDTKVSGYSDFFNNYNKRAFSGEKNYKSNHLFYPTIDIKMNSINNITTNHDTRDTRYQELSRSNNNLQSNYSPTNNNTRVNKLKRAPIDEITNNGNYIKKNLNQDFYSLGNNNYHTFNNNNNYINSNFNKTSPNIPIAKYISNMQKNPYNEEDERLSNDNINSNYPKRTIPINPNNDMQRNTELPGGNNTIGYYYKRPLSDNNIEAFQRANGQQKIMPNLYTFSRLENNNGLNDRNPKDRFHDLSLTMNYGGLNRPTPISPIKNQQMDFNQVLKRQQANGVSPNNGRITIVKKLPPLKTNTNQEDPVDSIKPINRQMNQPILTPIANNLKNSVDEKNNKPRITVQKLDNKGNPIPNGRNVQPGMYSNINNIKNNNLLNNPINNVSPNAAYKQNINQVNQEQKQVLDAATINKNYLAQNQVMDAANTNKNFIPQKQVVDAANINKNYMTQNKMMDAAIINKNYIPQTQASNTIFNQAHQQNQLQNAAYINPLQNNINTMNMIKQENNEKLENQEMEENEENNNINNNQSQMSAKNNIDISYNDFDGSGWIKNYGGVSRPGRDINGNKKINQDSLVSLTNINNIKDFNIFGVLDGHGVQGHFVSQYAAEFIPSEIINHPAIKSLSDPEQIYNKLKENNCEIMTNACLLCDESLKKAEFDAYNSGTTCNLIIHIGTHIICINIGDSRSIIAYNEQDDDQDLQYLESAQLSVDNKPDVPEEKNRILMCGGMVGKVKNEFGVEVGPFRVWARGANYPGLAMSRSIGDLKGKSIGIVPDPGIMEYDLCESSKYIIIGSDGVWEFLKNEIVKDIGKKYYLEDNASEFCHQIINNAVIQWQKNEVIIDDITVVAIFF